MKTSVGTACLLAFLTPLPSPALSWDGVDTDSGADIEIERGNHVRVGNDIEYYDCEAGEYRGAEVTGVYRPGYSVIIEVRDRESGETRAFKTE